MGSTGRRYCPTHRACRLTSAETPMNAAAEILSPGAPAPVVRHSSFYLAMRTPPQEQREAMYAVYAFCRAVDDIADDGDPRAARLAMLDQWRADIARLYDGGGPTDLTRELARALARFGFRQQDFLDVIDGMEMDV